MNLTLNGGNLEIYLEMRRQDTNIIHTTAACLCRVSDESGTLEMTAVNEMPLKKEHLDPYVSILHRVTVF